jgi:rhodanese-related sulfurtransferase
MNAIVAANRGEASFPWPHVGYDVTVPSVGVGKATEWLNKHHALVIDVREPWEYAEGHIPGALSIPQAELASRLAELPKERAALVACATGNRSLRAAGFLKAVGYDRAANLAGGTDGWKEAGNPVEKGS